MDDCGVGRESRRSSADRSAQIRTPKRRASASYCPACLRGIQRSAAHCPSARSRIPIWERNGSGNSVSHRSYEAASEKHRSPRNAVASLRGLLIAGIAKQTRGHLGTQPLNAALLRAAHLGVLSGARRIGRISGLSGGSSSGGGLI
jgi:hypothetical protein